jgi:DNA-binding NarL/FixJ family response regulator
MTSRLTPRQDRLARLIANGYTRAEAAHVLRITELDVELELLAIYAHLRIATRAELVAHVRALPDRRPVSFATFDWWSIPS